MTERNKRRDAFGPDLAGLSDPQRDRVVDDYLKEHGGLHKYDKADHEYPARSASSMERAERVGQMRSRGDVHGPLGDVLADGGGTSAGQGSAFSRALGQRADTAARAALEAMRPHLTADQWDALYWRVEEGLTVQQCADRLGRSKAHIDRMRGPWALALALVKLADPYDGLAGIQMNESLRTVAAALQTDAYRAKSDSAKCPAP